MYANRRKKELKIQFPKSKKKNKNSTDDGDASSSSAVAANAVDAQPPPPSPPWLELPRDLTANILHRLGTIEILETARKVCTSWWRMFQDPEMWQVIDMKNTSYCQETPFCLEKMCRYAVDRSQGLLNDINIEYFGTDELLQYIAKRSSQLKRLRLACCDEITGKGLHEAVREFPELEELHLYFMHSSISASDIEAIGLYCPKMKCFTYTECGDWYDFSEGDKIALSVAKAMPNLHDIRLFGCKITNEGLQVILDSCPNLESLDLRLCHNIKLKGDLGKRCLQIKNLKRPNDSTDDFEWVGEVFQRKFDDGYSYYSDDDYHMIPSSLVPADYFYDYDDYDLFGDGGFLF